MVGFVSGDLNQGSKLKNPTEPPDPSEKIDDFGVSFADSFLDFENIDRWIEEMSEAAEGGSEKVQFAVAERCTEMVEGGCCGETTLGGSIADGSEPIVTSSEPIRDESDGCVNMLKGESLRFGNLGCLIEQEMGKVSLAGSKNDLVFVDGNGIESGHLVNNADTLKTDDSDSDGNESANSSGSQSSASSSSSSSLSSSGTGDDDDDSDDDIDDPKEKEGEREGEDEDEEEEEVVVVESEEEKEMVGVEEVEEGEIKEDSGNGNEEDGDDYSEGEEVMIAGSGLEDDSDEDGKGGAIRSKNEIEVLPPVPHLDVKLQQHHQTQPVGAVLSIMGAKIIVEGSEKHNPLTEGSILWITESRSPLGLVDEIFGPVRNPYYVVRYNSDSEVPTNVCEGTLISYVQEFANHILNDSSLYKKGYDASGENDEEVSDGEFSDDEKEAEYKKTLKMIKRGTNDQKLGNRKNNRKKIKNRDGAWKNGQYSKGGDRETPDRGQQHHAPEVAASSLFGMGQFSAGGGQPVPPYPQMAAQVAGFFPPSSGMWASGMMPPPNSFLTEAMTWPPQNQHPYPFQMPMPNVMPFQQQFDPGHAAFPNAIFSSGQSNFFMRPTYPPPWPALNQANFAMGLQAPQANPIISTGGEQGLVPTGLPMSQCDIRPPAVSPAKVQAPQQFNQRAPFGRSKKPFQRGGGRFAGGRGRGRGRGRDHQAI